MDSTNPILFLAIALLLGVFALMIAALVSPPDPFTLIMYSVPLLLISVFLSYLLTYKHGFEYLKSRL